MFKIIFGVLLGNYLFLLINNLFRFLLNKYIKNSAMKNLNGALNFDKDIWRDLNVKRDFK